MLSSWSLRHHGLKKCVAWWLYQRRDLSAVNLLHATSQPEAAEFEAVSPTQPIAVIPNGVEIRTPFKSRCAVPPDRAGQRSILFLSRLHPKKGLLDLVEAWAEVRPPGWRVVVGGGEEENYRQQVEAAVREKGLAHEFDFIGQVPDGNKWDLYFRSNLFVLPSLSENFGLVIGEALACGVPVIATRCTPWEELLTRRCGWWIDSGPKPLAEALRHATALTDAQRHEMGARGRSLIESKYTWANVAREMKSVYEWLLGIALKPGCVY
jgi:glycosyltransferase involved in cell wall biosynthesis